MLNECSKRSASSTSRPKSSSFTSAIEFVIVSKSSPVIALVAGASPNAVALSPDGKYLYVADGTINAVAVVKLNNNEEYDTDFVLSKSNIVKSKDLNQIQ
jgi:DNA-binding beta-propeller fold protein YncE